MSLTTLPAHERYAVLAGLGGTVALAWAWLVPASLDMYGTMDGLSAWMMTAAWDAPYLLMMVAMWSVMMVGMMVPSAAPTVLLFARIVRERPEPHAPRLRTYAFAAGYVIAWTGFSVLATLAQWGLAGLALVTPMMESATPAFGGALLMVAGLYQWTPAKARCLTRCRSPLFFLLQHWRPDVRGAVSLGIRHGLYCVGCCWALMLLLFAGGVMSLAWIAAITAFVLLEKLAPFGAQGGRLSGALLVLAGGWMVLAATMSA